MKTECVFFKNQGYGLAKVEKTCIMTENCEKRLKKSHGLQFAQQKNKSHLKMRIRINKSPFDSRIETEVPDIKIDLQFPEDQ